MTRELQSQVLISSPEIQSDFALGKGNRMILNSEWSEILSKIELGAGLLATLVLIAVHVSVLLHAGALWRDEVNCLNLANLSSLSMVWGMNEYDSFPMLWFLVLRYWTALGFGDTDFALRVVGLIIGISTVAVLWWVVLRIGNCVPLISLLLFGFSPTAIRIGDSLRAYGLGILLMLLMLAAIWLVVENPTPKRVIFASLAAVISVQCLFYNSVLLLAVCVGGIVVSLCRCAWKTVGLLLGIGFIAAVTLLPYIGVLTQGQSWRILFRIPLNLLWIPAKFYEAVLPSGAAIPWLWLFLLVIVLEVCHHKILGRPCESNKADRHKAVFFVVSLILGIFLYTLFLKILSYITDPWYYISLMAFLAVFFDAATNLVVHNKILWRIARLGFFVVFAVLISRNSWQAAQVRQTNIDLIAAKLEAIADKEDLIVLLPWWPGASFMRYYHGSTPWMTVPSIEDHRIHRYDLIKLKMMEPEPIQTVLDRIQDTLRSGHKVWLAGSPLFSSTSKPPEHLPPAPHGPQGWYEGAYTVSWLRQAVYEIQECAARISEVPMELGSPVNPKESLSLFLAEGWYPMRSGNHARATN